MPIDVYKGTPYPIVQHPRGLLSTRLGANLIKSDVLMLLLTNPSERVMLPEFGTPLKDLFFQPNDEATWTAAREMIIQSINSWEPRVVVSKIEVTTSTEELEERLAPSDLQNVQNNILIIRIEFYDPETIGKIEQLELKLPLSNLE
jgi:phage baseplate assembly protein W